MKRATCLAWSVFLFACGSSGSSSSPDARSTSPEPDGDVTHNEGGGSRPDATGPNGEAGTADGEEPNGARDAGGSDAERDAEVAAGDGAVRDAKEFDADHGLDAGTSDAALPLLFSAGKISWGANGHTDQPGAYAPGGSISLAQQIADLKNIFGETPNTILYRAVGEKTNGVNSVVTTLQASGIIPSMLLLGYPNVTGFSNEAAAYAYGYNDAAVVLQAAPTLQVFEIGNEWTNKQMTHSGDGSTADDWRSESTYALYRGVLAGAIAAIRDANRKDTFIVGGELSGWTELGLALAFSEDLASYKLPDGGTRALRWDYTCLHWYNDATSGGNKMGLPDDFSGGMNAYTTLKGAGAPLLMNEFGSSNGNSASLDSNAATNLLGLLNNLVLHAKTTSTEPGVAGGAVYQLYQSDGQNDYFLYTVTGTTTTLSTQGQAVKTWIAAHGNPT